MKILLGIFLFQLMGTMLCAQVGTEVSEMAELAAENEDLEKDDSYVYQREYLRRHPLSINDVTEQELVESGLLDENHLHSFLEYRRLMGDFVSIYELQSIPGWDIGFIRSLLPYILLRQEADLMNGKLGAVNEGEHLVLLRWSKRSKMDPYWQGSPFSMQFRYKYRYQNQWQWGVLADKDAGEPLLSKWNAKGFDFYSFHFYARKQGRIESLALGDFTVNMGQGLIQWQQLAFKKGAGMLGVKRQGAVLRPYSAAGEYNFHRGAGITLQKERMHVTGFVSFRSLDANIYRDSMDGYALKASSLLQGGLHRTWGEAADRNKELLITGGGSIQRKGNRFSAGLNIIHYLFSIPIQKVNEPYNFYALKGKGWSNYSVDYSYTFRNFHFFGEMALDALHHPALIQGILISLDNMLDMAVLYRNLHKGYQTLFSNAFTERPVPGNEEGIYWGISYRPFPKWQLDSYFDWYRMPWLQFQLDRPGKGRESFHQITYLPNRNSKLVFRYRNEIKLSAAEGSRPVILIPVEEEMRQQFRLQLEQQLSKVWGIRSRLDWLRLVKESKANETGFLAYIDLAYSPRLLPVDGRVRWQVYETGGYDSRIYAFENDVPLSGRTGAFYGKGMYWYICGSYNMTRNKQSKNKINMNFSLKFAQTVERNQQFPVFLGDKSKKLITNDLKIQIFIRR